MAKKLIDYRTHPERYRHWKLSFNGPVATLAMDVDEQAGLFENSNLKLNSYDLGVDIELSDAVQRLRFEHPEVKAVVITSQKENVFCAGANIGMLGMASHVEKVNFCKFTNETRNAIEDASQFSGQKYLCAINGTAAGGGYELAMATDYIILIDDGSASVSLPELPLLAVLPGTGGLTRLMDKRKVRRDHADFFCTTEEGVRGRRAIEWNLVDELTPRSKFAEKVQERALEFCKNSDRPDKERGVELSTLDRKITEDHIEYRHVLAKIDRNNRCAEIVVHGPDSDAPDTIEQMHESGAAFWPLVLVRELDDLILHLRTNETEIGTLVFRTNGDIEKVTSFDTFLLKSKNHWLVSEIVLYWKRTLKRLDVTSRSLLCFIEPGSCFAGLLFELVICADRSYMLDGQFDEDDAAPATVILSGMNFGLLHTLNNLTRLQTRFLGDDQTLKAIEKTINQPLDAGQCDELGLVTFIPDDIDWHDETRLAIEERSSFSADALSGMEANLRFAGPETMETKIFGRLSAWQNWIFQRPNAVGEQGALTLYRSGRKGSFDPHRV